MRRVVAILALVGGALFQSPTVHVGAAQASVFKGKGWTLVERAVSTPHGQAIRGTLQTPKHRYTVEGDWIPAGDAGGDLLRIFGHPWPNATFIGLVGVATLYNTCNPNCAQSRIFALTPIAPFGLPDDAKNTPVRLVAQG